MSVKKNNGITRIKYGEKTQYCFYCGKTLVPSSFYKSNSIIAENNHKKMWVCKQCTLKIYNRLLEVTEDKYYSLYRICQMLDIYFNENLAKTAITQEEKDEDGAISPIKFYIQKINSLPQYTDKTFANTDARVLFSSGSMTQSDFMELSDEAKKNMEEVVSLLHYDPFKDDPIKDRPYLYNTILNYLNPNTIKNSFKLSSIIEITRMFCQTNNINNTINSLLKDATMESKTQKLKALIDIKKSLNNQITNFSKQNGIYANKDSLNSGADTLTGIMMDLRNKKITMADTDYMDIKSAEAFQHISRINAESIMEQLMLNENDYVDMIKESKEYIEKIDSENTKLQEENQQLKLKFHFLSEEMKKRGFDVSFE